MSRTETTSTLTRTDFSLLEVPESESGEWNVCPTIDPTSLVGPGRGGIYIYDAFLIEEEVPVRSRVGNPSLVLYDAQRERFQQLAAAWKSEVRFLSDTNEICSHPAYQEIIGMGVSVLPFIFEELEREPDSWFWALKAITGQDPVPEEHRGNVDLMARDWLKWAQEYKKSMPSELGRFLARFAF